MYLDKLYPSDGPHIERFKTRKNFDILEGFLSGGIPIQGIFTGGSVSFIHASGSSSFNSLYAVNMTADQIYSGDTSLQDIINSIYSGVTGSFTGGTVDHLIVTGGTSANTLYVGGVQLDLSGTTGQTLVHNGIGAVFSDLNAGTVSYVNGSYTTVQQALDFLLYVTPNITALNNNINTVEKGLVFTSITLTWSINKTVISQSLNQGIGSINPALRTYVHSGISMSTDTTYTLTVNDGTNSTNRSSATAFRQKRYWGTSSSTSLTNAEILALSSEFATSRATSKTVNASGGKYVYFAYPASFGVGTFFMGGFETSFNEQIISFTNSSNFTESYYVYRSVNIQNSSSISVQVT